MEVEKVKAIIYLLFSIRGRITRKQWWFGIGVWYLFWICIGFVAGFFRVRLMDIMEVPIGISTLWILSAMSIKRLHDRNLPGWSIIIAIIPTMATWILLASIPGLRGIIPLFWIVVFGCLRGDAGKNRYGPAPKPLFKSIGGSHQ